MRLARTWLALALAALLAAGCASPPKAPPAAGAGKRPAYYSDDGPPLNVPGNLEAIADAVPTGEPYHRFANRPYTVFGRTYVPVVNNEPRRERGVASWYGRKFHGRKTASGEVYDMFAMTAAHKTLPIPSFARVTNVRDGRSVIVRVNDRGPFLEERVIDLSFAAATRLGIAGPGSGLVEVERVFAGSAPMLAATPRPAAPATGSVATPLRPGPSVVASAIEPDPTPAPVLVEAPVVAPDAGGLWLQLGAFSSAENAESFRAHIANRLTWIFEPITISALGGLHRVRLGPYGQREEALAIAEKVRQSLGIAPVLSPR